MQVFFKRTNTNTRTVMKKDLVAFDVETTGLNPHKDFIIQLAMIKLDGESLNVKEQKKCYIRPEGEYEITPQAFEKHGITKEFLKVNGVNLKSIAQKIIDFFEDCDILTYNGNNFDINFLYSNLKDTGFDFKLEGRIFYDAYLMYKRLHPSTLEAVYKYYTGDELEGAHDAFNDVKATIEVFRHIQDTEGLSLEEMQELDENKLYSPEKSIIVKQVAGSDDSTSVYENCEIVFASGKHKDEEFMKICKQDPNYIKWFMENVASDYTKSVLRGYYKTNKCKTL